MVELARYVLSLSALSVSLLTLSVPSVLRETSGRRQL